MRLQHETLVERNAQQEALTEKVRVPFAVIAIAAGEGVQELFRSLGTSYIISGDQAMNPSTEDILEAVKEVNAEQVIISPNNKNIFMAADQAVEVADVPVAVVPFKTISQGATAILAFNDQQSLKENKASMTEISDNVVSGQVTIAARDAIVDDVEIKRDDFLGMIDGKIIVSEADRFNTSLDALNRMIDEDTEIVAIIVDEDGSAEEAEKLIAILVSENDELEIELHEGGQPVYPYLFPTE